MAPSAVPSAPMANAANMLGPACTTERTLTLVRINTMPNIDPGALEKIVDRGLPWNHFQVREQHSNENTHERRPERAEQRHTLLQLERDENDSSEDDDKGEGVGDQRVVDRRVGEHRA